MIVKELIELDDDVFNDIRESDFDSARDIVRNFQATITDAIRNGITKRKVGKWIGERGYPICEKCGCNIYEKYISCSDYAEITTKMDYCPNCGCRMTNED